MTLYLDTSALIKLYIEEPQSEQVVQAVRHANAIVTSALAYPETRATLTRAKRERRLSQADYQQALTKFLEDWEQTGIIAAHDAIMTTAGTLAEQHALRRTDAVHLASALSIADAFASTPRTFFFLVFDRPLVRGAQREHLAMYLLNTAGA